MSQKPIQGVAVALGLLLAISSSAYGADLLIDDFDDPSRYADSQANDLSQFTDDDGTMALDLATGTELQLQWDQSSDYWYSRLADSGCFNATAYLGVAFRVFSDTSGRSFDINLRDYDSGCSTPQDHWVSLASMGVSVTTGTQDVIIPFSAFGVDPSRLYEVRLSNFSPSSGLVFIGDLRLVDTLPPPPICDSYHSQTALGFQTGHPGYNPSNGRLYIPDRDTGDFAVYDAISGAWLDRFGIGHGAAGVAYSPGLDQIYLMGGTGEGVTVLDSSDQIVDDFNVSLGAEGQDIAVDASGNLYISVPGGGNGTGIYKFDGGGSYLLGPDGAAFTTGLLWPAGVDVHLGDGRVFVADSTQGELVVFNASGSRIDSVGSLNQPDGVDVDETDGVVYVVERGLDRILVYDLDLNFIQAIGSSGIGNGQLAAPVGVVVNAGGDKVHVTDSGNTRLQSFGCGPAPTATVTPSVSPSPSVTETDTPSVTETDTPSVTETDTPSVTETDTPSVTETDTPSVTETDTPSVTETDTPSVTETATGTATPTITETASPSTTGTATPTATETATPSATATSTPSITQTATPTASPTITATHTDSPTITPSPTLTPDLGCSIWMDSATPFTSGLTSFSVSHTNTLPSGGILLVSLVVTSPSENVTSVQYNGIGLTRLRRDIADTYNDFELWYLVNPPAGTHSIAVVRGMTSALSGVAITYGGVNTASPFGGQSFVHSPGTSFINNSLNTVADNSWLFGVGAAGLSSGSLTAGGSQVVQATFDAPHRLRFSDRAVGAMGPYSLDYTLGVAANAAAQAVELRPGPCAVWTQTATRTDSPTPTASPTATPSATPSATHTASPTATATRTDSPTPSITPTETPQACGAIYQGAQAFSTLLANPSFSYSTLGGTHRLLVVQVVIASNIDGVSNIFYDGNSLIRAKHNAFDNQRLETWYLTSPPTGTQTLEIVRGTTNPMKVYVSSWVGMRQSNPIGASADSGFSSASATAQSLDIGHQGSVMLALHSAQSLTGQPAQGSGQLSRAQDNGNFTTHISTKSAGIGTEQMTWIHGYSSWAVQAVELVRELCAGETATATVTASDTRTITATFSPSPTFSVSPTVTPSFSFSPTRSDTPTTSPTATISATWTDSPTATPSRTITETWTSSPTATPSFSESPTATITVTWTDSPTATPSRTITETWSASPTPSDSPTITVTRTVSPTFSVSPTATPTRTVSPTFSVSPTATPTRTVSPSHTVSPSATPQPCGALHDRVVFTGSFFGTYSAAYSVGPGTGRVLLVHVALSIANNIVTATYNGLPLSTALAPASNGNARVWTGILADPPAGNHTLVIATSNAGEPTKAWASTYVGIDTADPLGAVASAAPANVSSHAQVLSTLHDHSLVVGFVAEQNAGMGIPSLGPGQTLVGADIAVQPGMAGANYKTAGLAGPLSLSYSFATWGYPAFHAIELKRALCAGETATATRTYSPTATITPSFTASPTDSPSPTISATFTVSPTASPTRTVSPTPSDSPTASPTFSVSPTYSVSPTVTESFTASPTFSASPSPTPVPCGAYLNGAASQIQNNTSASVNFAFNTPAGQDRLLVVHVVIQSMVDGVASLSYGAQPLTRVRRDVDTGPGLVLETWYLVDPPVGSATVSVIRGSTGSLNSAAFSFAGVDGGVPIGAHSFATGSGTSLNGSLTTSFDESQTLMLAALPSIGVNIVSRGAGQVQVHQGAGNLRSVGDRKPAPTAGLQGVSLGFSGSSNYALQLVELKSASCGTPSPTRTPSPDFSPTESPVLSQTFTPSPAYSPTPTATISPTHTPIPTRLDLQAWDPGQASNEAAFAFRVTNWGADPVALNRISIRVWVHEAGFAAGQWQATAFGGGQEIRDAADGFVANVSTAPVPVVSAYGPSDCGGGRQASVQIAASIPSAQSIPGGGGYLRTAGDTNNLFKLNHSYSPMNQAQFYSKPTDWGTTYATRSQTIYAAVYLDGVLQCEWSSPSIMDTNGGQEPCAISGCPANTPTPTESYTPSPSFTASPTATPSGTETLTPTGSPTPTATGTDTATGTASATPTVSPTVTATPTATPTATETDTLTVTETATPTDSPTATATPTATPTATETDTSTATETATPTDSPTATATPTATPTASETDTSTATETATPTDSPTATATITPTATGTATPTATETTTLTDSPTATATLTASGTATPTVTETPTPTSTPSATPSDSPTATATPSASPTFTPVPAPSWLSCSWSWRKRIVLQGSQIQGTHTGFPAYIELNDADLQARARSDGFDLYFSDHDGVTQLPHEIESWDPGSGALKAWVKVPVLDHGVDRVLYLYYGNPGSPDQQSTAAVWSNAYQAVYHLHDDEDDSTAAARHGINGGSTVIDGKFADARHFNAAHIDAGTWDPAPGGLTIEGWVWYDSFASDGRVISKAFNDQDQDHVFMLSNFVDKARLRVKTGGSDFSGTDLLVGNITLQTGRWMHLAATFDGTLMRLYVDGVLDTEAAHFSPGALRSNSWPVWIGNNAMGSLVQHNGRLDEVRAASAARSVGWMATQFANQSDPTAFAAADAQEQSGCPTATPTETPTDTPTATPSATETATPTATESATPTDTPTSTATPTDTPSATETATPTVSASPTGTPSGTLTASSTESATPTDSPTSTATPSDTPSATETATPTATESPTPTDSPSSTATPTDTPSTTETASPTATESPTPTDSPSSTVTPTDTPSSTETATPTATESATPTATETATRTATETATSTATESATPTVSPSSTATPTDTPSATETATPTATATDTPTATESATPTDSPTPTATPSATPSATETATLTATGTSTPSATETASPTDSPTASATPTATPSATETATLTATLTATPSATLTATPTETLTATGTATFTATQSATPTPTDSPTPTASVTATPSATLSATPSDSPTATGTLTPSPSPSGTPTPTLSATPSPSPTATPSASPSGTASVSPTPSLSASPSPSPTQTPLPPSPTATATETPYLSPTPTATITMTFTETLTPLPTGTPEAPAVLSHNVWRPRQGPLRIGIKPSQDGQVRVRAFNMAGELVATPLDAWLLAGVTREALWHGDNAQGEGVASGVYVVSVQGAGVRRLLKVVLMK